MPEAQFLAELEQAFAGKLGRMIASPGPRAAFPLRLQHAMAYTAPRLALIGDAAHTIHPLAGQGVNLGLLDAATLAEVILDAHRADKDISSTATLRRYERCRKGDNLAMMAAMDGFKRLFGNNLAPLRLLRSAGLNLVNAATPVKNLVVRHAMGLSGDLPKMAKG
jgi:2-octaprenylphenol hydroxylase